MPNPSHKSFEKDRQLLGFFSTCFKRPDFGVYELGFDFEHFFYCFIHSVSLTFYSKLSWLIIPHKSDMNHDQGISIPQGPITRTRAKKLQQTLYSYIQTMVSSSKKILEDVRDYVSKKIDSYSISLARASNVLVLGFPN